MHRIFTDSDIVISSLISQTGASNLLLHHKNVACYISSYSTTELTRVVKRLNLKEDKLKTLINERLKKVKLRETIGKIKEEYKEYTLDSDDTHIVAGAVKAKAGFLISYNLKHFKIEKIKRDFNIKVTTPANFLQYLRSL